VSAQVVVLQPPTPVEPGGQTVMRLAVVNPSTVVDIFDLTVLGPLAPYATAEPPEFHLFPGQQAEATVVVRPPADTRLFGPTPVGVKVTSRDQPAESTVVEATVEVGGAPKVQITLHPRRHEGGRHSHHQLVVDNTGNIAASVQLSGLDPAEEQLSVSVRPQEVTVAPGTAVTATVRVTANHFSPGVDRAFQVVAEVVGQGVQTADGVLAQRRRRPAWLVPVAIVAVMAIVAAVAFWGRSKPTSSAGTAPNLALVGSAGSGTTVAGGPSTSTGASGGGGGGGGAAVAGKPAGGGQGPSTTRPGNGTGGPTGGDGKPAQPGTPITRSLLVATHANIDLPTAANTLATINTVTLPAGQWLVRGAAAVVDFGTGDYARCALVAGATPVDITAAYVGTNASVEGIENQALVSSGGGVAMTQRCEHDHGGAAVYVDAGATLLAQQVNGAQAAATTKQTTLSTTGGAVVAVNGLTPGAGSQIVTAKAAVVNFGSDDIARCNLGISEGTWLDGTAATFGGAVTPVESIADIARATGPVAQACASDHGAAAYVDPSASLVTRPELPGTQLARTTSATNLANGADSPTVVTSVTVPAGSWALSWKVAAVNFGANDFVRCVLSTPSAALDGTTAFLGGGHSAVAVLSSLAVLQTPSTVTVNLSCQHDGAVAGIYIDPSAVVLAEPTGALS
jgi:hypothetical protein